MSDLPLKQLVRLCFHSRRYCMFPTLTVKFMRTIGIRKQKEMKTRWLVTGIDRCWSFKNLVYSISPIIIAMTFIIEVHRESKGSWNDWRSFVRKEALEHIYLFLVYFHTAGPSLRTITNYCRLWWIVTNPGNRWLRIATTPVVTNCDLYLTLLNFMVISLACAGFDFASYQCHVLHAYQVLWPFWISSAIYLLKYCLRKNNRERNRYSNQQANWVCKLNSEHPLTFVVSMLSLFRFRFCE